MSLPTPKPGIMDIAPYVGGESKIPGIDEPIKLASNENTLGASPHAVEALRQMADQAQWYPDGGHTELRHALAEAHGLEADRLVCANGSDELIGLLTKAYAGPGDEVLFSEHGFAMYPISTMAAGATAVRAKDDGLGASVDNFLAAVTDKTRVVFLANPNNPTGTFLPPEEVARLHAGLREDILFVIDAAYAEYIVRNDYSAGLELARQHRNVVVTRTFSKIYALAALRLGWCYADPEIIGVLHRVRGPFNVNAMALAAGVAAVRDVAHVDMSRTHNSEWLPWFQDHVREIGLESPPSIGNFVLVRFPGTDGQDANAANDYLTTKGIITRKVANYGLPDCIRVTIGTEAQLRATVDALNAFAKQ